MTVAQISRADLRPPRAGGPWRAGPAPDWALDLDRPRDSDELLRCLTKATAAAGQVIVDGAVYVRLGCRVPNPDTIALSCWPAHISARGDEHVAWIGVELAADELAQFVAFTVVTRAGRTPTDGTLLVNGRSRDLDALIDHVERMITDQWQGTYELAAGPGRPVTFADLVDAYRQLLPPAS